jgi:hypothetical protein
MFNVWSFDNIDAVCASGLGGGSLIYANVLLRKDERWFVRERHGHGSWKDGYEYWPLTRAELDPHHDRVERMMNARDVHPIISASSRACSLTAVPRVRVTLPDELRQRAATRAEALGKEIDDLYADAIDRYVEVNKNASAGSLRSRSGIPRASPQLNIEVPEQLFQRAEKLAKRWASGAT